MAIWIRNVLYASLLVAISPLLILRSIRSGKYRRGWRDKLLGFRRPPFPGSIRCSTVETIWLHGVSVGEVRLLEPIIKEFVRVRPDARFAVSTSTDSGMDLAQSLFGQHSQLAGRVQLLYFPLDFSWAVRRVFKSLKPSMLVLCELELWPNLISIAKEEQCPIAVVNGRLSQRSYRGYKRADALTKPMFSSLSFVGAQNAEYADRFTACGVGTDAISVTGSIKFDNVAFDRNCDAVTKLRDLVGIRGVQDDAPGSKARVFLAGSTQVEEEQGAIAAHLACREQWPSLRTIIVPRHPERFDAVAESLERAGVMFWRRSEVSTPLSIDDWEILLVDTIGELAQWWGLAEIALVGGSFGRRGGQNMMEPAAYGANVAFGPHTSNFRDVAELLLGEGGATRLTDIEQLGSWLHGELTNPAPGRRRGANARKLVTSQQGALQRTIAEIMPLLEAEPRCVEDIRAA